MYQEVKEKVAVLAYFPGGNLVPKAFKWQGRKHLISKVNLTYQEREGESINYFYAVETPSGGVFKLAYNDKKLFWLLEEYWLE